jgi:hypothetical protein
MVNINEIKTIENAKNADYNGKKLTSSEQSIFDNWLLKGKIIGIPNAKELKNTALLLDSVKKAEKVELSDGLLLVNELLNDMKSAKEDNTIAYQVVNSYNKLVDETIIRIESLARNVNLQGIRGRDNIELNENFEAADLKIEAENDADNIQGIDGRGDVKIKGFVLRGAEIRTSSRQIARTEEDIQDEITSKNKQLERKNKKYDVCEKNNDAKAMEKADREIEQLEKKIDELKAEFRQAQQEVHPK